MRRPTWRALAALTLAILPTLMISPVAQAQGGSGAPAKVRVGALKLTSSAPLFVGVDKGFFREFGIEPELAFFQAAAPIATALAAGQIEVGATGLTAALYNIVLGGEQLWIVADKGREWPGYPLVGIVVQKELHDAGMRSIRDLRGKRIGVTQLGSTLHYQLGNVLEKDGLTLDDVKVVPLQAIPAAAEALKGKQVDAIVVPQPFPSGIEAQGYGRVLFWAGDLHPWQTAAIFYGKGFAASRARAVAFMKGYVKASRFYHDAVLVQREGRSAPGPGYDDVVAITAKYTGARPEIVRLGFSFQDRSGRLLVPDIDRQVKWWTSHGFMKRPLALKEVVDTSFIEAAIKELGG